MVSTVDLKVVSSFKYLSSWEVISFSEEPLPSDIFYGEVPLSFCIIYFSS